MEFKFDVAIIGGLGHVGLPLGIVFADKLLRVLLIDINIDSAKQVESGKMPFVEYGAEELLQNALSKELLTISSNYSDVKEAQNIIICIGTPIDEYLNPKTKGFLSAIEKYSEYITKEQLVIIRSSVYPGTCKQVHRVLGESINLSYCPERIVQGYAIRELSNLPQIVSGFSQEATDKASDLFKIITKDIVMATISQAELSKLFSNAWRYIQFAATNQFYMICAESGENYNDIRNIMMHGYERMSGFPSSGFTAGPCLLKDTMQLANISPNAHYLSQAAMHINEGMPSFLVRMLKNTHSLVGTKVGILGMAFKADIDDTRDSLSFKLKKLLAFEGAEVLCTDAFADYPDLLSLDYVLLNSEIIIIGAPHTIYKNINISAKVKVLDIWDILST